MDLIVDRTDLQKTRVVDAPPPPLDAGQARLRIERFGLSANNVTYGVIGDMLQYWEFFPTEPGWGRVPVWGFAEVTEARTDAVQVGQRVFGFLPMSDELVVAVGRTDERGLLDVSEHRSAMATAYNHYRFVAPDAGTSTAEDDEAARMLLHPLFFTGFLVDDFLGENDYFGASTLVISSASSKTAIGIAHLASARPDLTVVGLTSATNRSFTEGLGVYDRVGTYDDPTLDDHPAAYVDVSGSTAVRATVHGHYGDRLTHSMILGATHWSEMGGGEPLPGAEPTFFFAPTQVAQRTREWGQERFDEAFDAAWAAYAPWVRGWLRFEDRKGPSSVAATWRELYDNVSDPSVGFIATMAGVDE